MTPCQPLTARTDDLYPFVYYLNFQTPSGTYLLRVKNNNKINSHATLFEFMKNIFLNALVSIYTKPLIFDLFSGYAFSL